MNAQQAGETSLTVFFKDVMAKCQPMSRTVGVMGMTLKTDEFAQFDNVYKRASSVYPALVGNGADDNLWRKSYVVSEQLREQGNKSVCSMYFFSPTYSTVSQAYFSLHKTLKRETN
jgi:hypothetical protein